MSTVPSSEHCFTCE